MTKNYIPKELQKSHDFCFFLHDQMVSILKSGEEAKIFDGSLVVKSDSDGEAIGKLQGEELLDWLEKNSYDDEANLYYYKQLAAAITSDMLNFLFEALKCSEKHKLTVAFALLRKPLKENLFFLEWLLAKPEDFVNRFKLKEDKRFSFPYEVSKERRIEIIKNSMIASKGDEWVEAELIYNIRYQKTADYGLEGIWQKSNHLVTTFKHLKTEEYNLNMIFSNTEASDSQWSGMYSVLPLLILHALYVVRKIFSSFAEIDEKYLNNIELRTQIGFLLWSSKSGLEKIKDIFSNDEITCDHCTKGFNLETEDFRLFYETGHFICPHCLEPLET